MVSPLNNKGENDVPDRDVFQEMLELEARIKDADVAQSLDIASLRTELKEIKEQMKELTELIIAVKGFVKLIGYSERLIGFCLKWSAIIASLYAVYKLGLVELAEKAKTVGGK